MRCRRFAAAGARGILRRIAADIRRVLQVHTRYRHEGGEDRVVEAERRLITDAGIAVEQVIFDNAALRESESIVGDLRLGASAIWSRSAQRRVRAAIDQHTPDVVHVHNTFVAASPSVYGAARRAGVPVVQTLHNYRLVCPAATAFRDGHACTDCVGRPIPWPSVVHACVRGSHGQSAVAAATLAGHRALGTYTRRIEAYLALTAFQRDLMVRGGLPVEKISIVPNFLEPDPGVGGEDRSGILYVGRLSIEKGIEPLAAAAALAPGLVRIAGDGPHAQPVVQGARAGHLDYLGRVDPGEVLRALRSAVALVMPSICFEGLPMAIVEAYATGTPVIASRIGSLAEVVEDGGTGLLADPGDPRSLADRIRWAHDHPGEMRAMGERARARYETQFRGAPHLAALLAVYAAAAEGASPARA